MKKRSYFDPKVGFNISISRTGTGRNDTRYGMLGSTRNRPRCPRRCSSKVKPFEQLKEIPTYSQAKQQAAYTGQAVPEDEEEEERPRSKTRRPADEDEEDADELETAGDDEDAVDDDDDDTETAADDAVDDDDEDAAPPKKKKPAPVEDDDDEDAAPPPKKKKNRPRLRTMTTMPRQRRTTMMHLSTMLTTMRLLRRKRRSLLLSKMTTIPRSRWMPTILATRSTSMKSPRTMTMHPASAKEEGSSSAAKEAGTFRQAKAQEAVADLRFNPEEVRPTGPPLYYEELTRSRSLKRKHDRFPMKSRIQKRHWKTSQKNLTQTLASWTSTAMLSKSAPRSCASCLRRA